MEELKWKENWTSGNIHYALHFPPVDFFFAIILKLIYEAVFHILTWKGLCSEIQRGEALVKVIHYCKSYSLLLASLFSCTCCLEKCLSIFAIIGLECLASLQGKKSFFGLMLMTHLPVQPEGKQWITDVGSDSLPWIVHGVAVHFSEACW